MKRGVLAIAMLMALAGCGESVGQVSGKVTLDGAAVTSGQVAFTGQNGVPLVADIQADGTYQVKGVPYGEVIVTVVCQSPDAQSHMEQVNAARKQYGERIAKGETVTPPLVPGAPKANLLPARYGNPHESPLRFTVSSQQGTFNVDMTKSK